MGMSMSMSMSMSMDNYFYFKNDTNADVNIDIIFDIYWLTSIFTSSFNEEVVAYTRLCIKPRI